MAAVNNVKVFALVMLMIVGVSMFSGVTVSAKDCSDDVQALISKCRQYVMKDGPKKAPSGACCSVVKGIDLPCLCKKVTPAIGALLDVQKVAYVATTCGRPIPHGTKCGSITIPVA